MNDVFYECEWVKRSCAIYIDHKLLIQTIFPRNFQGIWKDKILQFEETKNCLNQGKFTHFILVRFNKMLVIWMEGIKPQLFELQIIRSSV